MMGMNTHKQRQQISTGKSLVKAIVYRVHERSISCKSDFFCSFFMLAVKVF